MPASSSAARTVTEVLDKNIVILLDSGCGRCVAIVHSTVNHVKACLPLIQPQLEAGTASPREVLCPPFNVEDAVRRSATYRCEYAKPAIDQIEVVPVREDRVVVSGPWQALVGERGVRSRELSVTVRRQIDRGETLVIQSVREGQRDSDHRIIPVIADVSRAWHDAAADLTYSVLTYASSCSRCRRRSSRPACHRCTCCCCRRTRRRRW